MAAAAPAEIPEETKLTAELASSIREVTLYELLIGSRYRILERDPERDHRPRQYCGRVERAAESPVQAGLWTVFVSEVVDMNTRHPLGGEDTPFNPRDWIFLTSGETAAAKRALGSGKCEQALPASVLSEIYKFVGPNRRPRRNRRLGPKTRKHRTPQNNRRIQK